LNLMTASFSGYAWSNAYNPANGFGLIFLIVAALLGASSIAGEVARGTILTLLARPVSRARILAVKQGVNAALLLILALAGAGVSLLVSLIMGHPQSLGGELVSALLLWLGGCFVLGVATLASTVFPDTLRPVAIALVAIVALGLPALNPDWSAWTLPKYWTNLDAFLGQAFPTKSLIVGFIAAVIPNLAAYPAFQRRQY
ncbi:MAG TPA: ABC transporter permease subunit, partial [Deinococcales bacterium]|nr:ABC transporter permease subunit [Deinococcales bacterium]